MLIIGYGFAHYTTSVFWKRKLPPRRHGSEETSLLRICWAGQAWIGKETRNFPPFAASTHGPAAYGSLSITKVASPAAPPPQFWKTARAEYGSALRERVWITGP